MSMLKVFLAGAGLAAACHAGGASATCTVTYTAPFAVSRAPVLVVDADLPSGSLIRATGADSATSTIRCAARTTTDVSMELQGDGLVSGNVREITVGGQASGMGIRLYMKGPGDTVYTALPRRVSRTFPPGKANWQTFFYVEYVRTGGPVKYGLADVASNGRLGRIWVPDAIAFPQNRLINPVTMERLELSRPACSIETGSLDQQVSLGEYNGTKLRNGQDAPTWRPFQLTMAACADPANLLADIAFGSAADADANDPTTFYMNAGGPGGYGIAIETADGAHRMLPGQSHGFPAVSAGLSYAFRARLQRTIGTISSGRVNRPVTVRVTFR